MGVSYMYRYIYIYIYICMNVYRKGGKQLTTSSGVEWSGVEGTPQQKEAESLFHHYIHT